MSIPMRQGDVLLIPVKSIPSSVNKMDKKGKKRIELAYGEVTGHAHALYEPEVVEAYGHPENGPEELPSFISVKERTELRHEEHSAILLEPGSYEVIIQNEWDSVLNAARKVAD
jgi:hypothetical protein